MKTIDIPTPTQLRLERAAAQAQVVEAAVEAIVRALKTRGAPVDVELDGPQYAARDAIVERFKGTGWHVEVLAGNQHVGPCARVREYNHDDR